MKKKFLLLAAGLLSAMACFAWSESIPKLRIGMNINSLNYWDPGAVIFTDVMTTADFRVDWSDDFTGVPLDTNGYPTQIPYPGQGSKVVRFLINNYYKGRYVVLYDGQGTLKVNAVSSTTMNGKLYIDLTGTGGNVWIDITSSTAGNYIRNIRIVPQQYADGSSYPTFRQDFLDGLKPFHALRFMDWLATNNSTVKTWADRVKKTSRSQMEKGVCLEYCIELCNTLNVDGWFCIPHMADDDFIRRFAGMVKTNLKPGLKAYFEYSNEIWNWMFDQSHWVLENAKNPPANNQYVIDSLTAINPNAADHPEKDAFMISRMFKLLYEVYVTPEERSRMVKVAAVQHGWPDNTRRILLFLKNRGYRIMPDVVSPGGYFNFTQADHDKWNSMDPSQVTPEMILDAVAADYPNNEAQWTDETATYAKQFGVGYVVYEGGQHMQPWQQGDWAYNPAVWAAQIHPKMFDMYLTNFKKHIQPNVNCQLFMAFSYVGIRESKWGSWGHLEKYEDIHPDSVVHHVPKYNALLYCNTPKADSLRAPLFSSASAGGGQFDVSITSPSPGATIYYSLDGKYPFTLKYTSPVRIPANTTIYAIASKTGYVHSSVSKATVVATLYALTVNSGTGSGSYAEGTKVKVTAAAAPAGKIFDKWTGDVQYLKNPDDSINEITMPAKSISITATYKDKPVTPIAIDVEKDEFLLYPNPAGRYVAIHAPAGKTYSLELFDMRGVLLLNRHLLTDEYVLDISSLSQGVYIVRIVSRNETHWLRLVKQ